jgi:creatinine amidohydrolase
MSSDILYSVKGPKILFEMTCEDVSKALEKTDIILISVGATEQHGPHLPLGTDVIQATEILRRAAAKLADDGITVVVGPLITMGLSSYHMDFPGSVTLTPSTLSGLIKDVCRSMYRHGFRKFLLKISHGGNRNIVQVVAQELLDELADVKIVSVYPYPVSYTVHEEILTSKGIGDGHGGEAETSRILAIYPNLVKLDRAKPSPGPEHGGSSTVYTPTRNMKLTTEFGSIGYPNYATKEKGDRVLDVMADFIRDVVKERLLD